MATKQVALSASGCGIGLVVGSGSVSHFTGNGVRFAVFGFVPSKKNVRWIEVGKVARQNFVGTFAKKRREIPK